MRASYFLWGILAVGVGVSLFLLKYKVQDLENELNASKAQVVHDRATIKVLQAEWTYLNDPERLRRLSSEHLGFGPPTSKNVSDIAALPFRPGVEVPPEMQAPIIAPVNSTLQPRGGVEANAGERGFAPVLMSRLQRLLFSTSAGAATPPASKEKARQ
jgi:hypothetical protein